MRMASAPTASLIPKSTPQACVSKDGRQTRCSFPSFETRPAAAPQGEILSLHAADHSMASHAGEVVPRLEAVAHAVERRTQPREMAQQHGHEAIVVDPLDAGAGVDLGG